MLQRIGVSGRNDGCCRCREWNDPQQMRGLETKYGEVGRSLWSRVMYALIGSVCCSMEGYLASDSELENSMG
jgi:hypothetical protein